MISIYNGLPKMESTFELNRKGTRSGIVYTGSFTYKRLNIGDQTKAEVLKTKLNGDLKNIDPDTNLFHEMLGTLRYGLIEYPDWWRESNFGLDLYDSNIVEELYLLSMKFEQDWIQKAKVNANSISEDSNK